MHSSGDKTNHYKKLTTPNKKKKGGDEGGFVSMCMCMCMCNMQCADWTLIILFLPTHADMLFYYILSKHMVMVDTKEGSVGCSAQVAVVVYCVTRWMVCAWVK